MLWVRPWHLGANKDNTNLVGEAASETFAPLCIVSRGIESLKDSAVFFV